MRTALAALVLCLIPAEAFAISRYNAQSMSCERIHAAIRNEGAVILRWRSLQNPNVQRYDRFVAHDGFCQSLERATTSYVPSSDSRSCPVYVCKSFDPRDGFFD